MDADKVNILLVDDQASKLLAYEVVLRELNENLLTATSASEALAHLLRTDVAVVLMDVSMPELDGFQLAAMIREHPRFRETAIIFVSAVHLNEVDFLRGYEMGAVDYVTVPVIPEVLRAKVRVFAELWRKTRQLEKLNDELEARVAERTLALEASTRRLEESEQRRNLALAAGQMGSWDWDVAKGDCHWDEGQHRIAGVDPATFSVSVASLRALIEGDDWERLVALIGSLSAAVPSCQAEFRIRRPDGQVRWCFATAAATVDGEGRLIRVGGVTMDITERKLAEERQALLAREVDHRAKNALALVQAIVRLSRGKTVEGYVAAVEGRIRALSRAHSLLAQSRWEGAELSRIADEELAPYRTADAGRVTVDGPSVSLDPQTAQALALALHELTTNAAKYGALSLDGGCVRLAWGARNGALSLEWSESGGPPAAKPSSQGYGLKVIHASIERQLGGEAHFDWRRAGLDCRITVPLRAGAPAAAAASGAPDPAEDSGADWLGPAQILLVEDESLVAMMMRDALASMNLDVVGPFASVSAAARPARTAPISGAILDVNVGGELVYSLAEDLAGRGIPFVFVTGYGVEAIDPRFGDAPVLQKPIDLEALKSVFADLLAARQRTTAGFAH